MNAEVKVERNQALDVAKGIGIFLVVFGHTCKQDYVVDFVYTFHVPLFFFLSGLLFRSENFSGFKEIVSKKSRGLLVPYVVYYLVSYAYWLGVERHFRSDSKGVNLLEPLLGLFYGSDVKSYMAPNPPLWFLTCLFTTEIILYLTVRIAPRKNSHVYLAGMLSLYAITGYMLSVCNVIRLPFSFNSSLMALFIMGAAFMFKRQLLNASASLSPVKAFVFALPLLYLVYHVSSINGYVDLNRNVYGRLELYILGVLSGSLAVFFLSVAIGKSPILEYFGRNSLVAFAFSEAIRRIVTFAYSKGLNEPIESMRNSIPLSILIALTVLVALTPIIFLINRYLGFLSGKSRMKPKPIKVTGRHG